MTALSKGTTSGVRISALTGKRQFKSQNYGGIIWMTKSKHNKNGVRNNYNGKNYE